MNNRDPREAALDSIYNLVMDEHKATDQLEWWHAETVYHLGLTPRGVDPEVRILLNDTHQFTGVEVNRNPVHLGPAERERVIRWLNLLGPEAMIQGVND